MEEKMKNNEIENNKIEFVILKLGKQKFGILVDRIRDILAPQKLACIPLASNEIAGSLNLRGKIVTALDTKIILGLNEQVDYKNAMNIVVEHEKEHLYSLLADEVNEVFNVNVSSLLPNPENMSITWQKFSIGIYPNQENLIIILNTNKMINHLLNRGAL